MPLYRIQEDYSHDFSAFKPDKKLRWLPHLGEIQLTIELRDRSISTQATPLEAAIIELFSAKGRMFSEFKAFSSSHPLDTWSVEDLCAELGSLEPALVHKALLIWIENGAIVDDGNNTFRLLEVADSSDNQTKPTVPRQSMFTYSLFGAR